jgi:hypothetical protein
MKKLLLLAACLMLALSMASAQTLMDFVSEVRGDTLVVKDFVDMGNQSNSLYNVILMDTLAVPAGRVYMLKANGTYPVANSPNTTRPTVIVGADPTMLVANKNAMSAPPVICGSTYEGGSNTGGINYSYDLTVKNCSIIPADAAMDLGWAFFWCNASNCRLTLDNNYFERTRWIFFATGSPGQRYFVSNCYFVNMNGQPCRRNGGVYDGFAFMDTMWVENSTHIMAQGSMYKFRQYPFKQVMMNHNTFINCAGIMFLDWGYQTNMANTNNIFVNCNVQAFGGLNPQDAGEQDLDALPMGLVNIHEFPSPDTSYDRFRSLPRQYLFEGNVVYWDPKLADMTATLNTNAVNGVTNWQSQMIVMNSRTTGFFADNTAWPYLTLGTNYTTLPAFTDPKDLLTTQVDNLKTFALGTVDTNSTDLLPDWRLVNIGTDFYIYSDWPIPVDLSYSDAALMAGGTGGYPVGDLNWFPARKSQWVAQRATEYAAINTALTTGTTTIATGVDDQGTSPLEFSLQQNYPNPFNPTTTISFTLPHSASTTLTVFNALGQEVATLVNGITAAGTHEVKFDASGLASGVYFSKLTSGDFTQMKKMMLVK